ncbi:MAG: MerR family DNA-binding transcriptional regulator [Bacillota bacterium]
MSEERSFSIKEILEQTGLSEDTIRYYEKIGLLPCVAKIESASISIDQSEHDEAHYASEKNGHVAG